VWQNCTDPSRATNACRSHLCHTPRSTTADLNPLISNLIDNPVAVTRAGTVKLSVSPAEASLHPLIPTSHTCKHTQPSQADRAAKRGLPSATRAWRQTPSARTRSPECRPADARGPHTRARASRTRKSHTRGPYTRAAPQQRPLYQSRIVRCARRESSSELRSCSTVAPPPPVAAAAAAAAGLLLLLLPAHLPARTHA